ncbi:hypothetical protein WR43_22500 [Mycolicibacter arupensis]|uniref:Uncharacterized protein n=1 Tax=Mycolicibacter arupensis TaxID=342002 RepID=A0A0M2WCY3_9MYCO|nr:hypothetical protein WR43_22500 [Mycolicibacter arupensis]
MVRLSGTCQVLTEQFVSLGVLNEAKFSSHCATASQLESRPFTVRRIPPWESVVLAEFGTPPAS